MAPAAQSTFAFGPFTFDSASGELRRNGQKLRVPEQASRLLTVLLERAGTVVTRQELRDLMWPGGEYLNHDHSISNAINQLRNILRDSSRAPVFIETIPKRGYRFMADVDRPFANRSAASPESTVVYPKIDTPETAALPESGTLNSSATEGGIRSLDPGSDTRASLSLASQDQNTSVPKLAVSPQDEPSSRRRREFLLVIGSAMLILVAFLAVSLPLKRKRTPPAYISMGIAPFEADGPGAKQIADGLRLDLTDALSQLPGIQVRAAHSFSSTNRDESSVRNLALTLQLDTLLFGKLTLNGSQLLLQLELVRGRDAVHLASFRYTGTRDELTSIRDEVQRDIYTRLESTTLDGQKVPGSTENPLAYEHYLDARANLLRWTNEPLSKVLEGFQAAIALDAGFARAYAEIASAYVIAAEHNLAPREDSYRHAEQMAQTAISLDPSQAEAHAALGFIHFRRDWDAPSAEKEMRQAVDLEPNQAIHHVMLALVLGNTGRFEESLHQVDLAHQDDPLWPPVYLTEMYVASSARLNDRALAAAEKLVHIMPDWPLAQDQRAWALWYSGRYQQAIAAWRSMALLEKDQARLAFEESGLEAFRHGGVPAYAHLHLDAIRSGHTWAHPNDFQPAEWYLNAGDPSGALSAIKTMVDQHDPEALQLAVSPAYASLHHDPQFLALLARVGLTLPQNYPKS